MNPGPAISALRIAGCSANLAHIASASARGLVLAGFAKTMGWAGVGGNAFHLLHASPVTSEILFNCIQRKGYDIQRTPYDQWRKKLLAIAQSSPDHHLYPLVALFPTQQTNTPAESNSELVSVEFDCQNAIAGLQNSNLSCPAIDENLLDTYLSYLIKTKQIQPPKSQLQTI